MLVLILAASSTLSGTIEISELSQNMILWLEKVNPNSDCKGD